MPQHTINMLEELLANGGNEDNKILGAGIKATLEHVSDMQVDVAFVKSELIQHIADKESHVSAEFQDCVKRHVRDKDQHTPKGILVRGNVIGWLTTAGLLLFTLFYIVASIVGVDELLKAAIP